MQTTETSQPAIGASEQVVARKLLQHVAEWKTLRVPTGTRTTAGVQVERRFRRRPDLGPSDDYGCSPSLSIETTVRPHFEATIGPGRLAAQERREPKGVSDRLLPSALAKSSCGLSRGTANGTSTHKFPIIFV